MSSGLAVGTNLLLTMVFQTVAVETSPEQGPWMAAVWESLCSSGGCGVFYAYEIFNN
jgi:hypothetical protein